MTTLHRAKSTLHTAIGMPIHIASPISLSNRSAFLAHGRLCNDVLDELLGTPATATQTTAEAAVEAEHRTSDIFVPKN